MEQTLPFIFIVNLVDGAIIYLTFGAPIAMYGIFQRKRRLSYRYLFSSASAIFIWPVSLVFIVGRQLSLPTAPALSTTKTRNLSYIDIRSRENSLAKTISRLVSGSISVEHRKPVIEAAERYACLKLGIIGEDRELSPIHEVFELSGHPKASLASKCVTRRNNMRLERHIAAAKADLVTALSHLPNDAFYDKARLIKTSARLATLLDDQDISATIKAAITSKAL